MRTIYNLASDLNIDDDTAVEIIDILDEKPDTFDNDMDEIYMKIREMITDRVLAVLKTGDYDDDIIHEYATEAVLYDIRREINMEVLSGQLELEYEETINNKI